MSFFKKNIPAWGFGIIAAILAVGAQALCNMQPPQAYGICIVCHTRDMVNSILHSLSGAQLDISVIGRSGLMLTAVMIPVGAFIASKLSGEHKKTKQGNGIAAFICGFIIMLCGLYISACPIRMLLRSAYGDIEAVLLVLLLILGIFCGTMILKRRAMRK